MPIDSFRSFMNLTIALLIHYKLDDESEKEQFTVLFYFSISIYCKYLFFFLFKRILKLTYDVKN